MAAEAMVVSETGATLSPKTADDSTHHYRRIAAQFDGQRQQYWRSCGYGSASSTSGGGDQYAQEKDNDRHDTRRELGHNGKIYQTIAQAAHGKQHGHDTRNEECQQDHG